MDIKGRILQSLRPRRDGMLSRYQVRDFGSPSQVSAALNSLCDNGLMVRVDRGVYAKPKTFEKLGRDVMLNLAKSKQNRPHISGRNTFHMTETARHVQQLAKRAGVEFVPTFADRWARAVTSLAGDDVKSDATDNLLVALTRRGKLKPDEMVKMVLAHHRALKRV